jgi:hypothetical protein
VFLDLSTDLSTEFVYLCVARARGGSRKWRVVGVWGVGARGTEGGRAFGAAAGWVNSETDGGFLMLLARLVGFLFSWFPSDQAETVVRPGPRACRPARREWALVRLLF